MEIQSILIIAGVIIALFVFLGLIMARLYQRATREVSLVKTGSGGKKVIMDGGTISIPFLHEISMVNMKTLRLEVTRDGDASLITKDRMRVDVGVEFYVSVNATEDGISRAAQTLGDRTFNVDQLREMIEGKLIDGLRSVAARMTMDELHENRSEFVQEVQNAISEDLLKNGLELEAVSLTALDQTPFDSLDENNAFNAVGMRKLAEVIAKSRKERAAITAEADVSVRRSEMEAEKLKYEIERDQREAEIAKNKKIEILQADQLAAIAQNQEEADRAAQEAKIEKERSVRAAEIERERLIRDAEISKEREIEVADQERKIIVAKKSEEESHARAEADKARAEAQKAEEEVETVRTVAIAERTKQIAIIEAQREAERAATEVLAKAQAEKEAAADRASAVLEEAQADASAITIRAEAKKIDMLAEAEGARAIADSENALSAEIVAMKVALARLEAMPRIVAEMVKPAEKIDSIKIHQISGMNAGGTGGNGAGGAPVNQALDSIMGMALQMPAMKKLGEELGISMESGLASVTNEAFDAAPVDEAEVSEDPAPAA
ncbi:MAG: flotillin [Rhodobacteraceae bacterium]|nr:flotillin [Paracoccaceae bacterium]